MIPTTSWDHIWNGVAGWFGVKSADMGSVLPARDNFPDLFTEYDMFAMLTTQGDSRSRLPKAPTEDVTTEVTDVSNGKDCGSGNLRLHVGNFATSDATQCAENVKAMSECSSTFFYAPALGWCKCQAAAGECSLIDSANYNQYNLSGPN